MAGITDIDFPVLLRALTPGKLRKVKMLTWLHVCTYHIAYVLYPKFKEWEAKAWYDIKYQSGQVAHLEYVLNEVFDPEDKRIFIGPGIFPERTYIFRDTEEQPLYIFTDAESQPVPLYLDSEFITGTCDFTVNVPASLTIDEIRFRAIANRYKRDGKKYIIKYY